MHRDATELSFKITVPPTVKQKFRDKVWAQPQNDYLGALL